MIINISLIVSFKTKESVIVNNNIKSEYIFNIFTAACLERYPRVVGLSRPERCSAVRLSGAVMAG